MRRRKTGSGGRLKKTRPEISARPSAKVCQAKICRARPTACKYPKARRCRRGISAGRASRKYSGCPEFCALRAKIRGCRRPRPRKISACRAALPSAKAPRPSVPARFLFQRSARARGRISSTPRIRRSTVRKSKRAKNKACSFKKTDSGCLFLFPLPRGFL